jgi:AcrR family transcriptional regulator
MTVIPLQTPAVRGRRTQDSRGRLLAAGRKLFVERGYHAARPQDISREAGLGHGTFYLHFADKQACFLAFVEEARAELDAHLRSCVDPQAGLEATVRASLEAIHDYSTQHPGVLDTAMMDASLIAADEARQETLVDRWAAQWAASLRNRYNDSGDIDEDDAGIVGAAIVGMIHEGSAYARRHGKSHERTMEVLTRIIVSALR